MGLNFVGYGGLIDDCLDIETAAVWEKAIPISGKDPRFIRQDAYGNEIHRQEYSNTSSAFGWQKDHITPKTLRGSDALWNLRPLHCRNNAELGGLLSVHLK
jgi:hypothetical protein